ncbi:metallophosphoesterase [Treponema sp. OMZ 840]|uniref:metallophosphoesterase n=1 Tax=Treponema sp. OMZ 840 TaxID=244313 RepID=UPI003D8C17C7
MKILCVSDQIDPIVYSSAAKDFFKDIDLVLCAGDLPMEYVDYIVSVLNKPTYFIFGNHNLEEFPYYHRKADSPYSTDRHTGDLSHAHGAIYAGFKVLREENLLIAGTSGSMLYNRGENQYTDKQMFFMLLKMLPKLLYNKLRYGRYVDIFLTHAPPLGIHDKKDRCHTGFACYLWFLRKFKPAYMVHGHIHLYDLQEKRVTEWNSTTIVNAYSHYIIEFGGVK